jgi:hypothetical protein
MRQEGNAHRHLPSDIPAGALPFLKDAGYLEPDRLSVGDEAPDVPFYTPEGEEVRLSRFRGVSPVVLVFGSHT